MNKQRGNAALGIFVIALWLAAVGGWIANLVKLIGVLDGPVNAWMIARAVGALAAPLGSILGYF